MKRGYSQSQKGVYIRRSQSVDMTKKLGGKGEEEEGNGWGKGEEEGNGWGEK